MIASSSTRSVIKEDELREQHPAVYERLLRDVKPLRDGENRRRSYRELWWLHAERRPGEVPITRRPRPNIATPETTKHRLFQFVTRSVLPEHGINVIGSDDAYHLGILSSRVTPPGHRRQAGGSALETTSGHNNSRCFQPFPFPTATDEQQTAIRTLGDAIDAHRKARQHEHPTLGLTDLYNAVEAIRAGRDLTAKEQKHATSGHAHTLADLHRRLDAAVLDAYGWPDLAPESPAFAQQTLTRLVALNAQRASEEATGHVRYLRPAFQNPESAGQAAMTLPSAQPAATQPAAPRPWPSDSAAQFVAVRQSVTALGSATPDAIAARFKGAGPATITPILDTLAQFGLVRHSADIYAA